MNAMTRKRVQERRQQRHRHNQVNLLIGIGVGAILIAGVLILISRPNSRTPELSIDYNGLKQETVQIGQASGFAVGDPEAPVTLIEFSDFSCSHCGAIEPAIHKLIDTYATDGRLRLIYMPMSFLSDQSVTAAKAAICASEQGEFWQMHDEIWEIYRAQGPSGYTDAALAERAETIGVIQDEFAICLASSRTQPTLDAVSVEFDIRGLSGTPSLFLNNEPFVLQSEETAYEDISAQIDALLNEE